MPRREPGPEPFTAWENTKFVAAVIVAPIFIPLLIIGEGLNDAVRRVAAAGRHRVRDWLRDPDAPQNMSDRP